MPKDFSEIFIKEALRTESNDFEKIMERLIQTKTIRLLHASMGMVTEAAEMLDALKKFIFYGKTLDVINLKEEIGDEFWYQAIATDELGSDFVEIQQMVLRKLARRYDLDNKKEFTEEKAINRDLVEERSTMEETIKEHRCPVWLNGKVRCLLGAGHTLAKHQYDPNEIHKAFPKWSENFVQKMAANRKKSLKKHIEQP